MDNETRRKINVALPFIRWQLVNALLIKSLANDWFSVGGLSSTLTDQDLPPELTQRGITVQILNDIMYQWNVFHGVQHDGILANLPKFAGIGDLPEVAE